ncbi:hypothetical protein BDR04DRAFT_1107820 [Suillus decipiens]|nr:hypothetical protein BDR04DRAFT_1107820 [Suillus decipiens]
MAGRSRRQYIKLEVISGQNLIVPSGRIPAGISVSINVDSWRRWKSSIKVLSSEESAVWGDTVTLSSHASRALSLEIRACYELGRRLGSGEIIGKLQISWDTLLGHGDEPFVLSFSPVYGVHPSLTLKTAVVNAYDNQNSQLSGSLVECKIARDTDAGHAHLAKYVTSKTVSQLKYAIQRFQLVLDQCRVGHLDRAAALTNLAWARLVGYIDNDLQDIDTAISLFRDAFALRPQCHPDHALSLRSLTNALTWRHDRKGTASDIREAARLYHELLPLCPEGTYLRSIVMVECNNLSTGASDEGIHLRRGVLELSVTLKDLNILKDRFTRAIREAQAEPRTDLIVLSRIIWDQIMLPIVNVLKHVLKLERLSRIWLCPTAAFTSIPLHAAHSFKTNPDRSKEPCLEDLYICSYTPTLSALVRSRQLIKKRVHPSFVAIGQGQPGEGKGKVLLAVDSELELVHKLIPATANRSTISGDAATRAGALKALEQNTWVHLACHGKQDRTQPYDSHFVMRDEHLTLLDIMDRDIPHAEFVFLSACHTAAGDEETPDEVIHLAAGLQFSGFKSVIGTLWEVDDSVVKHVVKAFYENMLKDLKDGVMDCTKAAWALNRAMHAVKKEVPLEQRMVFVHIGV